MWDEHEEENHRRLMSSSGLRYNGIFFKKTQRFLEREFVINCGDIRQNKNIWNQPPWGATRSFSTVIVSAAERNDSKDVQMGYASLTRGWIVCQKKSAPYIWMYNVIMLQWCRCGLHSARPALTTFVSLLPITPIFHYISSPEIHQRPAPLSPLGRKIKQKTFLYETMVELSTSYQVRRTVGLWSLVNINTDYILEVFSMFCVHTYQYPHSPCVAHH